MVVTAPPNAPFLFDTPQTECIVSGAAVGIGDRMVIGGWMMASGVVVSWVRQGGRDRRMQKHFWFSARRNVTAGKVFRPQGRGWLAAADGRWRRGAAGT
ncbi:hypothetical protein Tco_1440037 [Tanacetum coccineum]